MIGIDMRKPSTQFFTYRAQMSTQQIRNMVNVMIAAVIIVSSSIWNQNSLFPSFSFLIKSYKMLYIFCTLSAMPYAFDRQQLHYSSLTYIGSCQCEALSELSLIKIQDQYFFCLIVIGHDLTALGSAYVVFVTLIQGTCSDFKFPCVNYPAVPILSSFFFGIINI